MREILFRGLHRRKGEKVRLNGMPVESMWVYGGYCQYNAESGIIYQKEPIDKFSVYADSVGQYTGLTDKNGKRIYDGDIIKNIENGNIGRVAYMPEHCAFMIYSKADNRYYWLYDNDFKKIEIIGNIHDNPELLETN